MRQSDVILIAGPTASGKSALALALAEKLCGTIVNANSMQVYRDLRVITARPTPAEEARMPHRLYGHVDAAENYSVGRWCRDVGVALGEIAAQNRAAILVGGTGLYFKALTSGLAAVPPIPAEIRGQVRGRMRSEGAAALHAELMQRDSVTAQRLMVNDRTRISRALEVVLATGRSLTDWHREGMPALVDPNRAAKVFLTCERKELVAPDRNAFRRHAGGRRARRGEGVGGAQTRSLAAGYEGARRALADPASQRARYRSMRRRRAPSWTPAATPSASLLGSAIRCRIGPGWART